MFLTSETFWNVPEGLSSSGCPLLLWLNPSVTQRLSLRWDGCVSSQYCAHRAPLPLMLVSAQDQRGEQPEDAWSSCPISVACHFLAQRLLQHTLPRETSCSWPDTTMSGNGFSLSGKDMFYPLFFFFFFFFSKPALSRVLKRLSATCLWFCQGSGYQAFSPRCRLWYTAELQMYLHPLPLVRSIQLCFLEGEPQNLG